MFLMITLYTITYLGVMAGEFLLHGSWIAPSDLMPVYIMLLGVDAADQELRRWTGAGEEPRQRTIFVYAWALFYLTAFILHRVQPEFNLPSDLNLVTLLVLGVFFGSRISQAIFEWRSNNVYYTLP